MRQSNRMILLILATILLISTLVTANVFLVAVVKAVSYTHLDVYKRQAEGDAVAQGQTIGIMGMTGRATGPHVHFYLIQNETALDPSSLYQ